MARKNPIYVTKPHLPPLEDFIPYLEQIWQSGVLTNNGPFHKQLEQALCDYLGVKHIALFCNATIALVTALKALRIRGEVITTPFSFVATAHSLRWNNITPVFVDIDPVTMNLDPARIESAITPETTAIMPVHCYGNPCDVDAIEEIASNYNLRVIYDAAHAFGVNCHCGSVLTHGDLSVLSFHATKVFNTFEGGAIVCPDERTKRQIDNLKNFGFAGETTVVATGINGKMNEMQAAIGMLQLKTIDEAIVRRGEIAERYRVGLDGIAGVVCVPDSGQARSNHAYFPILVGPEYPLTRDELYELLKQHGINARRYFYPLITDFPMYRGLRSAAPDNLPHARRLASEVICLPIYPDLDEADVDRIINVIAKPQ
ncbi:MAG: DegT/DnrJ/EryC1/StrS family aminotransferase [Wenzhouxiangella sp.]